jgi:trigger factor
LVSGRLLSAWFTVHAASAGAWDKEFFELAKAKIIMQVTETLSQGLKREFKVVLPATELEQRLNDELATLKDRVRLNGFRPGKVPVGHLRRVYGRSVMGDVVQNAVNEANR